MPIRVVWCVDLLCVVLCCAARRGMFRRGAVCRASIVLRGGVVVLGMCVGALRRVSLRCGMARRIALGCGALGVLPRNVAPRCAALCGVRIVLYGVVFDHSVCAARCVPLARRGAARRGAARSVALGGDV